MSVVGFYEDANKNTLIAKSSTFKTRASRRDYLDGDDYRLADGTLEIWQDVIKYESKIRLIDVTQTDRDNLKTAYENGDSIWIFPDEEARPTEKFNVYWTGEYRERYDIVTGLYQIDMEIKEA